jgi:hypothetical protein
MRLLVAHHRRKAIIFCVLTLALTAQGVAAVGEKSDAELAFDRLKGLAGTWDAIEKGTPRKLTATYVMTGRGTVLVEDLAGPGSKMGGMATAYHLDKGTLVLTHFCGAGNQPRMRVKTIENDGRRFVFEMYDITNHPNPDSYYSSALDVRFVEDGTVELAYRGMTAGRESSQTFQLVKRLASTATP